MNWYIKRVILAPVLRMNCQGLEQKEVKEAKRSVGKLLE